MAGLAYHTEAEARRAVERAGARVLADPIGRAAWNAVIASGGRRHAEFRTLAANGQIGANAEALQAAAYTVTFARMHLEPAALLLSHVAEVQKGRPLSLVDIGAGPGTNALAARAASATRGVPVGSANYFALDHSPAMAELCQEIVCEMPGWRVTAAKDLLAVDQFEQGARPIVMCNHIFNQSSVTQTQVEEWASLIRRLAAGPRGALLLVVEPATPYDYGRRVRMKNVYGHLPRLLGLLAATTRSQFLEVDECDVHEDAGVRFGHHSATWFYGNASPIQGSWWTPNLESVEDLPPRSWLPKNYHAAILAVRLNAL